MKNESAARTNNRDQENAALDQELFEVVRGITELTWELKALNTTVIDLRQHVSYTDYVLITTGTSERHVQAIARRIDAAMREAGRPPLGSEGIEHGRWALLDYGDIIIHIFDGESRQDYNLERMWSEAPRLEFENKPEDLYGRFEVEQFGN